MRYLLIFIGWSAIVLGALGVVLPVLPTTPFILLAGACFAKSSPRFYQWLLNQAYFGEMITNYQKYKGISRKIKVRAILLMWLSMSFSAYLVGQLWLTLTLLLTAVAVSCYLWRLPEPPTLK
ncbi:YbaN family protein [Catenovulum adriaticum]|uniref:Inner membrane protein n=1 Tax=Catenovulum adriaticum TaxID=2984846 RepID=A0ABY7AIK6_9ALTE|nr:YbaN family protein [Catenovulum sp. TS8]WAJ69438.1 YbaN family protein [Catenovulum sp. TS8]